LRGAVAFKIPRPPRRRFGVVPCLSQSTASGSRPLSSSKSARLCQAGAKFGSAFTAQR
jgi:hypothetical protein